GRQCRFFVLSREVRAFAYGVASVVAWWLLTLDARAQSEGMTWLLQGTSASAYWPRGPIAGDWSALKSAVLAHASGYGTACIGTTSCNENAAGVSFASPYWHGQIPLIVDGAYRGSYLYRSNPVEEACPNGSSVPGF